MISRITIFLIINFIGLGLGGLFTGSGVSSEWYSELSKAPWTPPGWVFGFAWTTIMVCFAIFMALAHSTYARKSYLIGLFAIQWVLNLAWNPLFFYFHLTGLSLLVILALTVFIGYLWFVIYKELKWKSILIAPYFLWLLIASSLNLFIVISN